MFPCGLAGNILSYLFFLEDGEYRHRMLEKKFFLLKKNTLVISCKEISF